MSRQLNLLGYDSPRQVHPDSGRLDPVVWISRIVIVRALDTNPNDVIRDVRLRRGMNIVWAPPAGSDEGDLFQAGLAGHTAGKTTFCRFIRHVLGERHFANETTTRAIRERIPAGWILAEVRVGGVLWAVARPFAVGAHSFCVRGCTTELALAGGVERSDYSTFLEAIGAPTSFRLPARRLPSTGAVLDWMHILPWLTRDQECHFADFDEWRHPSSDSDAPSLSAEERHFLMRSVLGLISDEEGEEQSRHVQMLRDHRTAVQKSPQLAHESALDRQRLQRFMGVELPPLGSDLFGSLLSEASAQLQASIRVELERLTSIDRRDACRRSLENAVAAEANASRDVRDIDDRLRFEQAALDILDKTRQTDSARSVLASFPPSRDFCQVPLTVARERGCPLVEAPVVDLMSRIAERSINDEMSNHARIIKELESMLAQKRTASEAAQRARAAAQRALHDAQSEYDLVRESALAERARLQQLTWLADAAKETARDAERHANDVASVESRIDRSRERLQALREARQAALHKMSARYAYVVRAILGDDVQGSIRQSGRDLVLHVERDGERESAALDAVKAFAFDLGALTASIEGVGHFPPFLVHDCPREADLAPDIYARFFRFVQLLEACFQGEPGFQYIITTTTPPPQACAREPWLRLRLAGTPTQERLLRIDL